VRQGGAQRRQHIAGARHVARVDAPRSLRGLVLPRDDIQAEYENLVSTKYQTIRARMREGTKMNLKALVGSGDKIGLLTLPFLIVGLILNLAYPSLFDVGGPSTTLRVVSIVVLIAGVTIWAWSVVLILKKVPQGELITSGPYSLVKHPLYTAVALLVLPWIGFLFNTWLGAAIGIVLYMGSRIFAPAEEAALSTTFGAAWDKYRNAVKIPWL
jgi:protein-S-isoprenylcysteine O-methyltransferase Ste14